MVYWREFFIKNIHIYLKGVFEDLDGGVTGVTGEVTGDARVAGGETGVTGEARAGGSSLDIVIGIIRSTDTPLEYENL